MVAKWAIDLKESDFVFFELTNAKAGNKNVFKSFKSIDKHWWKSLGMTPPLQPLMVLLEGDNLSYEGFAKDWVDTFAGTGGFKFEAIKLSEKFHYAESSQQHGTMLQKISYQRNQAKEMLASIQNLKTAIINIESDLEKMDEQIKAFRDGDWEEIKSLFIDNYGGPQRSWNAVARNVPLVRMAMTWFLRLKIKHSSEEDMPIKAFASKKVTQMSDSKKAKETQEEIKGLKKRLDAGAKKNKDAMMKEIDGLVEDEQINPAIANYLKRKIQEFWNWVVDYAGWLVRNKNNIRANLLQQKANLKLYMRWATDHIKQADSMEMKPSFAADMPEFSFKSSPREIVKMEWVFYAGNNRPDIVENSAPWTPVVATTLLAGTTVDVPKKFTEMAFLTTHGYMHMDHVKELESAVKENAADLFGTMKESGVLTEEEMHKFFTAEEIEELKGGGPGEGGGLIEDLRGFWNTLQRSFLGLLKIFQIDIENTKEGLPWSLEMRAASVAAEMTQRGIKNFKKSHGMIVIE